MEYLRRLNKAIDYLKDSGIIHKQQDIADATGMSKGRISDALKGKPLILTPTFLSRFATAYRDYINRDWLIEGRGRMEAPRPDERPHYPISVSAGYTDIATDIVTEDQVEYRTLDSLYHKRRDFTIYAHGDSMFPTIYSRDVLMCRRLESEAQIKPSGIYVLATKEGHLVKRIEPTDTTFILHSDNPSFAPIEIDKSEVLLLAQVDGILRTLNPSDE